MYNSFSFISLYSQIKNIMSKTFTVSVTFTDMTAENPLEAAKKACSWLLGEPIGDSVGDASKMIYDVTDEQTNEKFTVDLSEDDEDAVLPD